MEQLATLKQMLVKADDFAALWDYFFDHYARDPEFMKLGRRLQGSFLEDLIAGIIPELLGRPVAKPEFLLTELPEVRFVHGAIRLRRGSGGVIFFGDIDLGLLVVPVSLRTGEMRYCRFSATPLGGRPQ